LLEKFKSDKSAVLAIPRGGVPIGYYITRTFHFSMDLLLAKKIGHPSNKELAIGAVSLEDEIIDDDGIATGNTLLAAISNYVPSKMPYRYNAFIYLDKTSALHPLHSKP
jgi:predicted phosphoribosyltransferase